MGIPSITTFCENGHIVSANAHHEVPEEKAIECGVCKSRTLKSIWEWGDEDNTVPFDPIKSEEFVSNHVVEVQVRVLDAVEEMEKQGSIGRIHGKLVRQVSVYDVSELFKEPKIDNDWSPTTII